MLYGAPGWARLVKGLRVQNRYAGDVGDFVKLALLQALAPGRRLGVAWYLYPDENHNADGRHVEYLSRPAKWQALNPELFGVLGQMAREERSVARLEAAVGVPGAVYFADPILTGDEPASRRSNGRQEWFSAAKRALRGCDLVFADLDNGLTDDRPERRRGKTFGKQMPLGEARSLATGRPAIVYHHNTRRPGGHDLEVDHWLNELGDAIAIRATMFGSRTFFVINPDLELRQRCETFCTKWAAHEVRLQLPESETENSRVRATTPVGSSEFGWGSGQAA